MFRLINQYSPDAYNAAEKPNVIIIFNDDQGYQDLGCFGSPNIIQNMTWAAPKTFFHFSAIIDNPDYSSLNAEFFKKTAYNRSCTWFNTLTGEYHKLNSDSMAVQKYW